MGQGGCKARPNPMDHSSEQGANTLAHSPTRHIVTSNQGLGWKQISGFKCSGAPIGTEMNSMENDLS